MKKVAIYIHIPFCLQKCIYCDFYSLPINNELVEKYIIFLQKEIKIRSYNFSKHQITSIFFGGGTPTCINPSHIATLIDCIAKNYHISKNCEITIESNPATNINFHNLRYLGFNRISIGIQSFVDKELQFLGRLHDASLAKKILINAKQYFDNINIDLIFSIPNQDENNLIFTLKTAIDFDIQHISAYNLIFEENTALYNMLKNRQITKKNDDEDADFYETVYSTLTKNNYTHYEVSNFAKAGFECLHNLNYWRRGEYLGFGAAAHSFLNNHRLANVSDVEKYCNLLNINKLPIVDDEILTDDEIFEEQIFLGLRSEGIDLSQANIAIDRNYINYLLENKFAEIVQNKFRLTSKGYFLSDTVSLQILNN